MMENPQQMLIEGLETAEEYISRLLDGMFKISELIQEGKEAEAKALFMEASEGLEWYTTILLAYKTLFPELTQKELQGKLIETSINETLEQYMQLVQALERGDYVLFGDILEYEVIPFLQYWSDAASEMTRLVKAN
jgi:hypothetical protein